MKKLIGGMLCLAMAVGMLPGMGCKAAEDSGEYTINMSAVSKDVKVDSDTGEGKTVVVTGISTVYNLTIEAAENEEVKVVFRGVSIDVSGEQKKAAVLVQGEGKVTIQLEGENTVKSAVDCAGIQKADGSGLLTITADKTNQRLTAKGGVGAAGIGGGERFAASKITISGNAEVVATGGVGAAGIGGGNLGAGFDIVIGGSTIVTATSGGIGATGIGGGYRGAGYNITIGDKAKVIATGYDAAGIGGSYYSDGYNITISGTAQVVATGGLYGAGIGGGFEGNGKNITISGTAQVYGIGGLGGAGIGGGFHGVGSDVKVYDGAKVSVSGGEYTGLNGDKDGSGAGIGDGGDDRSTIVPGKELTISYIDESEHPTFSGNVFYYEKGSSAESIKNGEATRTNCVTITLMANDGTETKDVLEESIGVPRALPQNKFTRDDHSFIGWNTKADGQGKDYKDEQQVAWDSDITLYAQWGHIYNQTIAEKEYQKNAATCMKAAVYYKSCACGAFDPDESGTFESGNPLGHEYKEMAGTARAATCTETGKEADQECNRCHDVITGAEIAKLAHTFNQEVATDKYLKTPADCAHKAVYYKSCVCGEKGAETFESGEALGHKWKAATGYAPKTCEVCGATEGDVINYTSEGENIIEFTQGDTKDVVKTFHRSEDDKNAINHYKGVKIDGRDVPVDAKSGSVIITFDAATLNALSVGDHIITVVFDDWVEELKLIIKAPVAAAVDATPVTGDMANPLLWTALVLLSMAGVALMIEKKRRRA
ncbi:MAG: InlB B-repeat-containing protein [Lachnospiraceae bacterium]|nr:InlB B-repeat-containing protein [Lachnospiraceae bacterium]